MKNFFIISKKWSLENVENFKGYSVLGFINSWLISQVFIESNKKIRKLKKIVFIRLFIYT